MLDFPNSPALNQLFTAPTGVSWAWDGAKWVNSNLSGITFAPLDSPHFTGNPTAPTSVVGDADDSIATTLFVQNSITAIVPPIPPSNSTPVMDGAGTAGSSGLWSRGDHQHPSDTSKLSLTGGTLTGPLTAAGHIIINDVPTNSRYIEFRSNNLTRWLLGNGTTAESGVATGSNLVLNSYDNSGAYFDSPISIERGTSKVTFSQDIGAKSITSALDTTVNRNLYVHGDTHSGLTSSGTNRYLEWMNAYYNAFDTTNGNRIWASNPGFVVYSMSLTAYGDLTIAGQAVKPGGGSWSSPSDSRIKHVVGTYDRGLNELLQLHPVRYRYKGNDDQIHDKNRMYVGLIAQDVEGVMPEMVHKYKGHVDSEAVDDLRTLDNSDLVYALVNAVRELTKRIRSLEMGI